MRITALAVATLLLAFGRRARTSVAQAPATAKILGTVGQSQPAKPTTSVAQRRSEAANFPVQQTGGTGEVQPAGQGPATPYPAFDPNCPQSMGTGTYPYGSSYGGGHPGGPFYGGHYGYFGGAHRTPGYPHHHLHRSTSARKARLRPKSAIRITPLRGPRNFLMDNPPSIGR